MILDSVLSLVSGGATGVIGGILGIWSDSKKHKQKIAEEKLSLERIKVESEEERKMITLENEFRDRVNIRDNEQKIIASDSERLQASYINDSASYSKGVSGALERLGEYNSFAAIMAVMSLSSLALADVLRAITRPVLTIWLVYKVSNATGDQALNAKIFLCTSAVSWWFASRSVGKPGAKNK